MLMNLPSFKDRQPLVICKCDLLLSQKQLINSDANVHFPEILIHIFGSVIQFTAKVQKIMGTPANFLKVTII